MDNIKKENEYNKAKLTERRIKQLVEDFNRENLDDKIIINIFRPNKIKKELFKSEPKQRNKNANNTHVKSSKNIFQCQKQKREINHESII